MFIPVQDLIKMQAVTLIYLLANVLSIFSKHFYRVLQNENELLQNQLREVKDENGRLHKLLNEKDFEIQFLRKKREEERLALAGRS